MPDVICSRCGATLTNEGFCEYCRWNSSNVIPEKTISISGLLCNLTVTKETCTFIPKVGFTSIVNNNEISQISLSPAPKVGSGELSILTITGFTNKITYLYPQNPNMQEIASYLLQVAPNAQFVNNSQNMEPTAVAGVVCPKCKSANTQSTGEFRKFSIWKIAVGAFIVATGIGSMSGGVGISLVVIALGLVLAANGLRIIGRKKMNFICLNCRKRFRI